MEVNCVFCHKIMLGDYDYETPYSVSFVPLNPVTMGHRLFVPKEHYRDALAYPYLTGRVMEDACIYASRMGQQMNIITSVGPSATQSVFHLHIHLVPRWYGDGLHLPWTNQ